MIFTIDQNNCILAYHWSFLLNDVIFYFTMGDVLPCTIDNVHKQNTFGEEAPCCTSGDVLPCTRGDVLPCTDGEELPKEAAGGFST